jgi:hypothetical protein
MRPKGISWGAPVEKFFPCLDLEQKSSFLDGHQEEKYWLETGLSISSVFVQIQTEFIGF